MTKLFQKSDFRNLVIGSALFGGGGGGSLEEGMIIVDKLKDYSPETASNFKLVDLQDMEESAEGKTVVSAMVAALGSPASSKGKTFIEESMATISKMKEVAAESGKTLKYIYSGEQGAGNTILPVYVAYALDMPVLDLDGNGRAVPAMTTGLQPLYKVRTSPVVMANIDEDTIVANVKSEDDSATCEKIARNMCNTYPVGIGFSAWLMDKKQHKNSALNQISLSVKIGEVISNSTADNVISSLSDALKSINFRAFVKSGTIKEIVMDIAGGFDTGYTVIESDNGDIYKVLFQNENLVAYGPDGEAIATVPGIISLIDLTPSDEAHPVPVSNAETYEGQKVALVYMNAPEPWNIPEGYSIWKEILVSAGYCNLKPRVIPE